LIAGGFCQKILHIQADQVCFFQPRVGMGEFFGFSERKGCSVVQFNKPRAFLGKESYIGSATKRAGYSLPSLLHELGNMLKTAIEAQSEITNMFVSYLTLSFFSCFQLVFDTLKWN
jgi:hypothetical protein